jgi:hypothetical protein
VSFYAKADASRALTLTVLQYFGSGGSAIVTPVSAVSLGNATTSFQRFTYTFSMPQTTGKTIATGNFVDISINMPASAFTIDFWGLQVEASNTATSFNTATGTIQGELAACQRYYWRNTLQTATEIANVVGRSSTVSDCIVNFPVPMRTNPSAVEYGGTPSLTDPNVAAYTVTSFSFVHATSYTGFIRPNTASGLTQGKFYTLGITTNGYLGFSAEL